MPPNVGTTGTAEPFSSIKKIEMKQLKYLLIFLITNAYSQNGSDIVKKLEQSAIPISNLSELDSSIYNVVKDYEIIMVGEMHGTKEPSNFVTGLVKLISKMEGNVLLAMEISKNDIGVINKLTTKKELEKTKYFTMENVDGRNGQAWFDLILNCNQLPGVQIEFIANENIEPRDSSMYLDIKAIHNLKPNTKIITLTGNLHNWLKPYKNKSKLGTYIINDSSSFNPNKIMSINHMYKEGTMMNNTGNGLEIKTIQGQDNFFNKTIPSKNYLCMTLFESQNQYAHFLYTEQVSHSEKLNN